MVISRRTKFVVECVTPDFSMSFQFVNNLWHARSQACRKGDHAHGAKHTACSTIPGNVVYRVRRRRFAEIRSGSIMGGSGKGGSIISLVRIGEISDLF